MIIESMLCCYSIGGDLLRIPDGVACSNGGPACCEKAQKRALAVGHEDYAIGAEPNRSP